MIDMCSMIGGFTLTDFFNVQRAKKNCVEHNILYKTHMQVENFNKME